MALLATRATITEEVAEEDWESQNVKYFFFSIVTWSSIVRQKCLKVIVWHFSLDEGCDDDTKHQAKDRVGEVGVVEKAGGEVGAEQLEGRLEDCDGAKEEI